MSFYKVKFNLSVTFAAVVFSPYQTWKGLDYSSLSEGTVLLCNSYLSTLKVSLTECCPTVM